MQDGELLHAVMSLPQRRESGRQAQPSRTYCPSLAFAVRPCSTEGRNRGGPKNSDAALSQDSARIRGESRKNRSKANETTLPQSLSGVQSKVAPTAMKGEHTSAQLAKRFDVHPSHITHWKTNCCSAQLRFSPPWPTKCEPAQDLKALHAKIGQQALETDRLAGALSRGSDASAKR
jgi:transposase